MSSKNLKEIKSVYEELRGILDSIPSGNTWFDDNGFAGRANQVINRVPSLCSEIEDVSTYTIRQDSIAGRGAIINCIPAMANLNSLIGRLKGLYDLDVESQNTGHTFIQNQSLNIELLLDIRGQIEKHLGDYKDDEPEKKFLEKVKGNLSTAKSAIDVIKLIISTAKEYSVSLAALSKIFGN